MAPDLRDVLLDRDGTIIQDGHYLDHPDQVRFLPGAISALKALVDHGYRLFLVTNQSGIGRGYFSLRQYQLVHQRLEAVLAQRGVFFTASLHCPHRPDQGCLCRKPAPGLVQRLVQDYELRPGRSVVIGDKQSDIELAKNAGLAGGILVATGKGCDQAQRLGLAPLGQEQYRVLVDIKGYDRLVYAQDLGAAASWLTQMPDLGSRSLRS